MTLDQIISIMKFQATNLKKTTANATEDTVLSDLLQADDGFGTVTSKSIFKAVMQYTFVENKHPSPRRRWPNTWMDMSIKDLAQKLVIVFFLFCSTATFSQLTIDLNTVKTDNKTNAIALGISYAKSLDSLFKVDDILVARNQSLFTVSPEINVRTGTADAFSSITAKAIGMFMFFKQTSIDGIVTANTSRPFSVIPLSIGFETNNKFSTLNTVVEAGFIPWYQVGNIPNWLKQTKVGFFLQAGYKSRWDSTSAPEGGQVDESQELPNSAIFRLKGSQAVSINSPVRIGGTPVSIVGSADEWLDIAHQAFYYRYDVRGRFQISPGQNVDIIYQKGSGAPNFNSGDQYGIGLNIIF